MRTLVIDKENCQKRSFEHGSCEGSGVLPKCKRSTVDRDHQSNIPQLKNMKLGSERRVMALEFPDTVAPADATCRQREQLVSGGKEFVDQTAWRTSRKTEMRPPKPIRDAVLGRMGQVSSFNPWMNSRSSKTSGRLDCVSYSGCEVSRNGKYNGEHVPLVDTMLMNNKGIEMGYKVNEGALKPPKKISGRLDGLSASGAEACSEKYAANRNEVEMIQMNSDGKEVGLEVRNLNSVPDNHQAADLCQNEVTKVLDLYRETVERLQKDDKMKPYGKGKIGIKIYVDAAMQLKDHMKWLNVDKCVGAVPGIEIGHQFQLRAELVIVGLHSKFVAGIDYKNIDGRLCATSIITSGQYGDKDHSSNVLIYVGEGGKAKNTSQKPQDQKLVRGNLALKNNINNVVPVRVIRKNTPDMKAPNRSVFIYDGLYFVRNCWPEHERRGNLIFKFELERIEGQHELTRWNRQNISRKSNKASHGHVVVGDISKGKENVPVRVVNSIDFERPLPFKYTTKMMYISQQCILFESSGCGCFNGCSEDITCSCIIKNNCIAVSVDEKEPIIYECGPCCKCPPDCQNRSSQRGIQLQLEIFKTTPTGWGVRSRNYISKGRFICEYVGELLQYNQKEGRINFVESALDEQYSDDEENDKFGNVGRFIRPSSSPNLYAKCVLFDHQDKRMPHVMLFAANNIPPGKELTFDYKL